MLSAFIVYLSIFLGKILRFIALEEIKPYKKSLLIAKNILLNLTALALLYSNLSIYLLTGIIGFFIFKYLKIPYFVIGLVSFLSFFYAQPILPLALVLILTLLHSSLEPLKLKSFILHSSLFVLPFTLVFIETFINAYLGIFTGLAIGGLLSLVNKGS